MASGGADAIETLDVRSEIREIIARWFLKPGYRRGRRGFGVTLAGSSRLSGIERVAHGGVDHVARGTRRRVHIVVGRIVSSATHVRTSSHRAIHAVHGGLTRGRVTILAHFDRGGIFTDQLSITVLIENTSCTAHHMTSVPSVQ